MTAMNDAQYARHLWGLYQRAVDAGATVFAEAYVDRFFEVCEDELQRSMLELIPPRRMP